MKLHDTDKRRSWALQATIYKVDGEEITTSFGTYAYNQEHARRKVLNDIYRNGWLAKAVKVIGVR